MKTFILIMTLLLVGTQSVSAGSCAEYSLDGEDCLRCIDHYHLEEGSCYVDILGCGSYSFGNICNACQDDYILVNNLCCDHACMIKFLKRDQNANVKAAVSSNFDILSKIIPKLNEKYGVQKGYNLIEIESKEYIDVTRYVLLYEFHAGKLVMHRAVVDYKTIGGDIIILDWSVVIDRTLFLEFHK